MQMQFNGTLANAAGITRLTIGITGTDGKRAAMEFKAENTTAPLVAVDAAAVPDYMALRGDYEPPLKPDPNEYVSAGGAGSYEYRFYPGLAVAAVRAFYPDTYHAVGIEACRFLVENVLTDGTMVTLIR